MKFALKKKEVSNTKKEKIALSDYKELLKDLEEKLRLYIKDDDE